jgi:hypothetical protein
MRMDRSCHPSFAPSSSVSCRLCPTVPTDNIGSLYIFRHEQLRDAHQTHLSKKTDKLISRARTRNQSGDSQSPNSSAASSPKARKLAFSPAHEKDQADGMAVGDLTLNAPETRTRIVSHNWKTIRNAMYVARNEHMSSVDDYVSIVLHSRDRRSRIQLTENRMVTRSDIRKITLRRRNQSPNQVQSRSAWMGSRTTAKRLPFSSMRREKMSSRRWRMILQSSARWLMGE